MSDPTLCCLFHRRNGYYYILYELEGRKKWKSTGCRLRGDALNALRDFQKLFRQRIPQKTLQQFTDEFLSYAKSTFAHRTWLIYKGALSHFQGITGNPLLQSITLQQLDQYKARRLNGKIAPVTVNIELRALKACMNTAVSWKLIETNPFAHMRQVGVQEAQPPYFSKTDFQRLLNAIGEQWLKDLVVFAAMTGMRRGEIVNLRWQDVELSRKLITVQSNPTFKTKQGKRRVVPMSELVFNLLNARAGRSTCEYVFHIGGKKINDDHASKKLKGYVDEAGLDGKLHFHSLRHSFATWLVQDGVSLYEVQKLLGHSNIAVTQVYSHLQPEGLHATVNRIDVTLN
jgi:integrase